MEIYMNGSVELYELNRSIIDQQGALDEVAIAEKFNLINTFADDTKNNFYMLYGREINYFTVFFNKFFYSSYRNSFILQT